MSHSDELPDLSRELSASRIAPIISVGDDDALSLLHPNVFAFVRHSNEQPRLTINRLVTPGSEEVTEDRELPFVRGGEPHKYWYRRHEYGKGFVNIKRDAITLKVSVFARVESAPSRYERVSVVSLRDRMLDGTAEVDRCPLPGWSYSNPLREHPHTNSIDISVHFRDVKQLLQVDPEHRRFLLNPYRFLTKDWALLEARTLDQEEEFLEHWFRAYKEVRRYPGRDGPSIPGAFKHFVQRAAFLIRRLDYETVATVPSYFHVVKVLQRPSYGFIFMSGPQKKAVNALDKALRTIRSELKEYGMEFSLRHASWVTVLQYVEREHLIPAKLRIGLAPPLRAFANVWMMRTKGDWSREFESGSTEGL